MLAQNQFVGIEADRFGSHDFVSFLVHQDTMLVYPGFMGKGVCSDNCLVRLYDNACNSREQATGTIDMLGVDIVFIRHDIAAGPQGHDNFFKRTVAGTFTDTVDRALNLSCSSLYGSE